MLIELKNYTILTNEEHLELLRLRNSDQIRQEMFTKASISLQQHLHFVDILQHDRKRIYYAVYVDKLFAGGISATNIAKRRCEWGVFFDQNSNFIAKSLAVYCFFDYLFEAVSLDFIQAKIKKTNTHALQFNKSFGFELVNDEDSYWVYELTKNKLEMNKNIQALKKHKRKFEILFEDKK